MGNPRRRNSFGARKRESPVLTWSKEPVWARQLFIDFGSLPVTMCDCTLTQSSFSVLVHDTLPGIAPTGDVMDGVLLSREGGCTCNARFYAG